MKISNTGIYLANNIPHFVVAGHNADIPVVLVGAGLSMALIGLIWIVCLMIY